MSYTMDKLNAIKTNEDGEIEDGFYEFIITGKMGDIGEPENGEYEMNGISSFLLIILHIYQMRQE
ncbi:MAG: hypothetical protein V8R51_02560 [Clostridia bacterium]